MEIKRRNRLKLLHLIRPIRPIGEPFNDTLFYVACVLEGGEAGERAFVKLASKLRAQSALVKGFQTTVVAHARAAGFGAMAFEDAAAAIGEDFGRLRDVFMLQLDEIVI